MIEAAFVNAKIKAGTANQRMVAGMTIRPCACATKDRAFIAAETKSIPMIALTRPVAIAPNFDIPVSAAGRYCSALWLLENDAILHL